MTMLCKRCGCELQSDKALLSEGYTFYCPDCDEDMYAVEAIETNEETDK